MIKHEENKRKVRKINPKEVVMIDLKRNAESETKFKDVI